MVRGRKVGTEKDHPKSQILVIEIRHFNIIAYRVSFRLPTIVAQKETCIPMAVPPENPHPHRNNNGKGTDPCVVSLSGPSELLVPNSHAHYGARWNHDADVLACHDSFSAGHTPTLSVQ